MSKALFVCYGGGHADALIPVIKFLIDNTEVEVEVIGINLAVDMLRKQGIPCKSLSNYLDIRAVEIGFPLAKKCHNFASTVSFADSIAYYGYTMSDLIDEVGKESAYQILDIFDRRTMFPVKTMMRILDKEMPDVVVTTTMNRFEAATLYAANKLGIASVKVEDLIGRINRTFPDKIQVDSVLERDDLIRNGISPNNIILKSELKNPVVMKYYEEIYQRQLDTRPTAFAVLCDFAKQQIESRGVDPATVYVTGQPAFDKHPIFLAETKKVIVCTKLGLDSTRPVITFMSQPNAEREDVFKALVKAYKLLDNNCIQMVIKLHPNEDGKIQKLILNNENVNSFTLVKDIDVRELLPISDLVITVSSTTGLEAAVMGKPLIYINVTEKEDYIPFDKMGIGIRCTSLEEIALQLKRIVLDREQPNLPNIGNYKTDGRAAERVGKLVEKLAHKDYEPTQNVVIIIQARMGSTRLPGKVMKDICGKPQIQHVIDSVSKSKFASEVVVATSTETNNIPLIKYLHEHNIECFEGDENDVLSRFIGAAHKYNADIIVRVTADNPLCDAFCIDRMIESHIRIGADYTMMKGLPIGIAGEVINSSALEAIYKMDNVTDSDKEHVTIYAYQHPDKFKINYIPAPSMYYYPEMHLTVDTSEDFQKIADIFGKFYKDGEINLREVIKYLNTII